MKFSIKWLIFGVATFASASTSSATLSLSVNTDTREFALLGFDTGTPFGFSSAGFIEWKLPGSGGITSAQSYGNGVAFSTDVGMPDSGTFGYDTRVAAQTSESGEVALALVVSTSVSQTITGSAVYQSYASLDPAALARLESAVGQNLLLEFGTGFSPVSVVAVPEPAMGSAVAGGIALFFCLLRGTLGRRIHRDHRRSRCLPCMRHQGITEVLDQPPEHLA